MGPQPYMDIEKGNGASHVPYLYGQVQTRPQDMTAMINQLSWLSIQSSMVPMTTSFSGSLWVSWNKPSQRL